MVKDYSKQSRVNITEYMGTHIWNDDKKVIIPNK
jgi:hypothetical protein